SVTVYVAPSLNTSCGCVAEALPTYTYAGNGAIKFQTGYGSGYGTRYGNGTGISYGRNAAGRSRNHRTTVTRGRANRRDAERACGKIAPLVTSSAKTVQQIVRRILHPLGAKRPLSMIVRVARIS